MQVDYQVEVKQFVNYAAMARVIAVEIRRRTYEHTKNLSPKELLAFFPQASQEVREQIARRREKKLSHPAHELAETE